MGPLVAATAVETFWQAHAEAFEAALVASLEEREPASLWQSMRYSCTAGGKRLRPFLVLASCQAAGGDPRAALGAAVALELVHTQSLIHDDLPCMDDDSLRRGRPTNHVVYGEALALLAGDALLAHAFDVLAESLPDTLPAATVRTLMAEFGRAIVAMVAGQVVDIASEGQAVGPDTLEFIHRHKTGALIRLGARLGAFVAGADPGLMERLTGYAEEVGLAFQIVDDLLDLTGTPESLGKSPGKDVVQGKATYPAVHGIEAARLEAVRLVESAIARVSPLGDAATPLVHLAQFVLERSH
ncbi:MAG: farnesyl diphosphate synthase [bacterium]|nr:farnesyl diphosphate synthase [bacterium]